MKHFLEWTIGDQFGITWIDFRDRDRSLWFTIVHRGSDLIGTLIERRGIQRHWGYLLATRHPEAVDIDELAAALETEDDVRLLAPISDLLDELGDGRLLFEDSARDALEGTESLYGVDRNARFVATPHRVNHFVDAHLIGGARVVSDGVVAPEA